MLCIILGLIALLYSYRRTQITRWYVIKGRTAMIAVPARLLIYGAKLHGIDSRRTEDGEKVRVKSDSASPLYQKLILEYKYKSGVLGRGCDGAYY